MVGIQTVHKHDDLDQPGYAARLVASTSSTSYGHCHQQLLRRAAAACDNMLSDLDVEGTVCKKLGITVRVRTHGFCVQQIATVS